MTKKTRKMLPKIRAVATRRGGGGGQGDPPPQDFDRQRCKTFLFKLPSTITACPQVLEDLVYYLLPPDFHIFLRLWRHEIEETVKPFTTYLLQLEKVIRDSILYASSEREVAGRRRHFKRFFASDCRISKGSVQYLFYLSVPCSIWFNMPQITYVPTSTWWNIYFIIKPKKYLASLPEHPQHIWIGTWVRGVKLSKLIS